MVVEAQANSERLRSSSGMSTPLVNRVLDWMVRLEISLFGCSAPAFKVCGYAGLALAWTLSLTLVIHAGLSPWVMASIAVASIGTFLAVAMAAKIITGEERLVYYRHEIAAILAATLLLRMARQPVLPYLDVTILGVGAFLACGRIGCLMVGCCHGRPNRWGVCYGPGHGAAGFTPYYVGIRLFPVQAVEAVGVAGTVVVGTGLVWIGRPAGEALAYYVVIYDVGRFLLEFFRGDPDRPYLAGFSEAQWLSVALTWGVAWAEFAGVLPFQAFPVLAAAGLSSIILGMSLWRWFRPTTHNLFQSARHVRELVAAICHVADGRTICPQAVSVATTGLGIRVSGGVIQHPSGPIRHYALSSLVDTMTPAMALTAARLILQFRHRSCCGELLCGEHAVFHLLVKEWADPLEQRLHHEGG